MQVTNIVQDSTGFLWIMSTVNLGRFDGYKLINYRDSLGNSLSGWLDVDGQGNAVVIDGDRIHTYNKKKDSFTTCSPPIEQESIRAIHFENDGIIWLGTKKGIFRYDPRKKTTTRSVNQTGDSVERRASNLIIDIEEYHDHLLVGTYSGIWLFDKVSKTFSRPFGSATNGSFLSVQPVRKIFQDKNHFWFYLPTKLVKTDREFNVLQQFEFPFNMRSNMANIDRDESGIFWIASYEQGLLSYDPLSGKVVRFRNNPTEPLTLASDILQSVMVDRDQNIWLGTDDKGLEQLKKHSLVFHNVFLPGSAAPGTPHVIEKGEIESLLLESKNKGFWISPITNDLDLIKMEPLRTLPRLVDLHTTSSLVGKNFLWVGSWGQGLTGVPLNKKTGLPENGPLKTMYHDSKNSNTIADNDAGIWLEDKSGNLWVTAPQNTLNKIDLSFPYGKKGSLSIYTHDLNDSTSLGAGELWGIVPDENGLLVLTRTSLDLFRNESFRHIYKIPNASTVYLCLAKAMDGTLLMGGTTGLLIGAPNGDTYNFQEVKALRDRLIYSIEEDKLGRFWLAGENGIFCYNRHDQTLYHFKQEDGLSSNEFSANSSAQTSDGKLFFTSANSVVVFNPASFNPNTGSPRTVVTKLLVNNKPVRIMANTSDQSDLFSIPQSISELPELTLNYQHNIFTLEFAVMQLTSPEKNLYQYKLEGFDPDWVKTDWSDRTATYTNLDPGKYLFKVKASNHDGIWSDHETTLVIHILPPPWRTWWAYTGYGFLFVVSLYAARRNLVQRERLKAGLKLEQLAREKEHFELEKAQEIDRVKTSFFTNISHEFRTPLTLIKGPVETLLDRFKDDPDVAQRLKLVQRNSEVLLRLINQLLDLAKLEAGTMKVEKSNSDINSFIRAIAGSFESLARHKNVTLFVEISSERSQVIIDKDKLETILINLINNAIKFTPAGGSVTVRTELKNLQANDETHSMGAPLRRRGVVGEVVIIVRDTGIGIPVEHQQKVFERFHQVSEAHKEIGTGIGLSLVKELIQLLEGTITVSSVPGRGTTFTVIIPVEAGTAETLEELVQPLSISNGHSNNEFHTKVSHNGAPERPHVLVVEDNDDLRAFIIDSLGQEFYFLEADNGRKGLEAATTEIPDLIISDVMMPEMDGITMAGKIKTDHRSSHIPLILLTAKSTEDSKLMGLKSGADDYLTKPFNREELLLKVRNSISRQIKLREKLRAEVMSSAPTVEVMSEDERFLVRVKEKILERLSDEQLSVESLADDIGISRVHLYRKVSGLTGLSVNELIRKLRLQRAAQLLEQQWGPVSQVAYEVGFSNLSYFSKVFKEEYGVLPSEYEKV